jgi:secreted protein with Ig-like and vWFA domain
MMMEFMNSHSDELGPYWPQPGRSILESLLADIPFPFQLKEAKSTSNWDESSATRIAHKLESPGIPDLAWARGQAEEEKFRMEVRIKLNKMLVMLCN